jgi:dolichol-phosphate mannosyltransferase
VYGLSLHRRIVSRVASWLMRIVFPTPGVTDYTCGYRAYRAEALQQAYAAYGDNLVSQDGFQCMVDVLLKLRRLPLIFGEVPMILRYDLKRGSSKMRLAKTAVNTLRLLFVRRFVG